MSDSSDVDRRKNNSSSGTVLTTEEEEDQGSSFPTQQQQQNSNEERYGAEGSSEFYGDETTKQPTAKSNKKNKKNKGGGSSSNNNSPTNAKKAEEAEEREEPSDAKMEDVGAGSGGNGADGGEESGNEAVDGEETGEEEKNSTTEENEEQEQREERADDDHPKDREDQQQRQRQQQQQQEQHEEEGEEPTRKRGAVELAYSTRGRSLATDDNSNNNKNNNHGASGSGRAGTDPHHSNHGGGHHGTDRQWERSVRETLDHDPMAAPTASTRKEATAGTSFLESLSEEERRTRTRFLPDVDGIHMLRKNEIKGDLALARSIINNNGQTQTIKKHKKHKHNKHEPNRDHTNHQHNTVGNNNEPKNDNNNDHDHHNRHHSTDNNNSKEQNNNDRFNNNNNNNNTSSAMEIDEEDETTPPSEDERITSDLNSSSNNNNTRSKKNEITKTMDIGNHYRLHLPNNAFVAPPKKRKHSDAANHYSATDNGSVGDAATNTSPDEDPQSSDNNNNPKAVTSSSEASSSTNNHKKKEFGSPLVVESVTAFNPPRPPESIGPKKKHRMLRWERRPADVEVDLSNYRKTVQRTREELHTAELELERMESVGTHLRRHYLNHLTCLNQEQQILAKDIAAKQKECVAAADLLTSRTRSRGGQYVMRDVLAVLKARGSELQDKMAEIGGEKNKKRVMAELRKKLNKNHNNTATPGIGGVSSTGLDDWDETTVIHAKQIASAWLLPNDSVQTPMGKGKILRIVDASNNSGSTTEGGGQPDVATSSSSSFPNNKYDNHQKRGKQRGGSSSAAAVAAKEEKIRSVVPPRICVELPFGIGFFPTSAVSSLENPASYSDAGLASRWKKMMETAAMVSGSLDTEGMESIMNTATTKISDDGESSSSSFKSQQQPKETTDDSSSLPKDYPTEDDNNNNGGGSAGGTTGDKPKNKKDGGKHRLLPFGSGLLTTSTGRGGRLTNGDIVELEQEIHSTLYSGGGVLGKKTNPGVPTETKKAEEHRQEHFTFQARVLQLRNELYRQRRIRTLNERTLAATRDRSMRLEGLVTEMRSDLKSLKLRLDEELRELGIDEDKAESILKAFYLEQEDDGMGEEEASPPKQRSRRLSRSEEDEMMESSHSGGGDLQGGGESTGSRHQEQEQFSDEDESSTSRPNKRMRPNQ